MKNFIRAVLQRLLSFPNYLFIFSLYSIRNFESGKYEREFLHFIKIIKKEGKVLDIGANIGITVAPLAKHVVDGEVHAFEPISENFAALKRVIRYLKLQNVKAFNIALGSQEGTLKMIMPSHGNSRMQGLSKAFEEGSDEKGTIYQVQLKRLDDLYPDEIDITAIKIDVENYELEVLKGAKNLLERNKPTIYCELWDNEVRYSVFDLVRSIGYEIYIFDNNSDSLVPVIANSKVSGNNFFFTYS
ncbi:MAG: hypothetical protein BGO21_02870 [Dyadobacter sp. 50-39]|uniref:FkbM family methyltransferase n=1 Tax=Dyadobacter sp. 50-39 TaxID=1895756 RepID=UPI000965CE58|nr:FkbM family methyltransferase [Dyadobacter sp. 50-39]OJV12703.1 MAG: hypothetical protein BGO21_02870 [Dyadobacter sp. 50-39]